VRRPGRLLAAAAPALFLVALAGPLLDPSRVLSVRDLAQFHLPLRAALMRLAEASALEWNPWIGGGQPVLSDPSYSAYYPATWLALLVPAGWSFSLAAAFHLALGAAGAFVLVRRLGARPAVAAFAAIAWSGTGALVSNLHAYTLLAGGAWMSWILIAAEASGSAPDAATRRRARLAMALAFALTLSNGEPVTVLCGGIAAGCLALARSGHGARLRALGGVAGAALLATGIAAVQLLPALARLARSERSAGLEREGALAWSLDWPRLLELAVPRVWGDPMRQSEGLYFGWGNPDFDFPYVISIYASLLVLVLAIAALARWPIPYRAAWTAMVGVGLLLALGRHTPVYGLLFDHVPPFSAIRFPEKFFLLVGLGLAIAAALGLEHLLRERAAGRRGVADLPLALGAVAGGLAAALAGFALLAPGRVIELAATHLALPVGERAHARLGEFFRGEALATLTVVAATIAVLIALRFGRWRATVLATLALSVVSGDLLRVHRSLLATAPAEIVSTPPPIAVQLPAGTRTVWSSTDFDVGGDLVLRGKETSQSLLARSIARLDPWTGILWGFRHVLTTDYSLTFTPSARRAVALARGLWDRREREALFRLVGAWGASATVVPKTALERLAEAHSGVRDAFPARIGPSPFALDEARFVAAARSYPDADAAEAALLAAEAPLDQREFLIAAPWEGERRFAPARLTAPVPELLDSVTLAVETSGEALLVVSTTWDRGWRATVDGRSTPVLETAAGYLAVVVPAGAATVRLDYRDPWVRAGAAASVLTLLGLAAAEIVRRRPRSGPAAT